MTRLHTLNDLISALCLGASGVAVIALGLAFADADLTDLDPRPAVRRGLETGRLVPLWQAAVHAGHDVNRAAAAAKSATHEARAQAAFTLAALLILTIPTTGEPR